VLVCWRATLQLCDAASNARIDRGGERPNLAFTAAEVTIIDAVIVLSLSLMFQNFQRDRQIVPLGAAAALFAL
jgi:hypothetical protein